MEWALQPKEKKVKKGIIVVSEYLKDAGWKRYQTQFMWLQRVVLEPTGRGVKG